MPVLTIRHLTRYRYRRPVAFGEHRIMVRPLEAHDQRVLRSDLVILPEPAELRFVQDVFGNGVVVARFAGRADTLSFESRVRLDHRPTRVDGEAQDRFDGSDPNVPFAYPADERPDLTGVITPGHSDAEGLLALWARSFLRTDGSTGVVAALAAMTRAIHADFRYAQRLYGPAQPPCETLRLGSGTCRDFAVLMMEAARTLGLAAQFVSGYIRCPAPDQGPVRKGAGHTHAWVRVYLPSCGWVEFDPTNGAVGAEDLIRVAVARDPRQVAPLTGSYDGAADDFLGMDVEVDVDEERGRERAPLRALMAA